MYQLYKTRIIVYYATRLFIKDKECFFICMFVPQFHHKLERLFCKQKSTFTHMYILFRNKVSGTFASLGIAVFHLWILVLCTFAAHSHHSSGNGSSVQTSYYMGSTPGDQPIVSVSTQVKYVSNNCTPTCFLE